MTFAPGSIVGIHLDLKYHVPNKAYLNEWLRRLPERGINTLLIEYEDTFPYRKHPFLRAKDAFTPAELKTLLETARGAGLTVIPLVQSLSHLEFALNHKELAGLREAPDVPTQICPSNPDAVRFVQELMAEVMEYHREDPFFHAGGDETWFLGTCPKCKAWLESKGAVAMWCDHQRRIIQPLLDAGKRPILWDDIFWKEPEAVLASGLPKEVVLHAWNYNVSSLDAGSGGAADQEFGGTGRKLRQVGVYRSAGHDVLGCPCLNWGQLFPRVPHVIGNTRAWARKSRAEKMLGVINSSWACFHVPLQTQEMLLSVTAALCRDPGADVGHAWQKEWLQAEFGAPADGVPQALETLSELWEVPMPDYGRPFSPAVYGYMSMVLHYPGRQDERRRRGAYPNDWDEIDFNAVYRKGLAEIRKGDLAPVYARMDELLRTYPAAAEAISRMARAAMRRKDKADMMQVFAEIKVLGVRTFSHLLRNDGDRVALAAEWRALRPRFERALSLAWEPEGRARMLRAMADPPLAALGG